MPKRTNTEATHLFKKSLEKQTWIATMLKKARLKQTDFRVALLSLFFHTANPLSATQIYEELRRSRSLNISFDRATLFRNLKILADKSVLSVTEFGTGANFFMKASGEKSFHQHHFFCVKCKTTEPINYCGISPMIEKARKKGLTVFSHRFELLGLCARCR